MPQKRTPQEKSSRKTRDAVEILDHMTGRDEKLRESIERETLNAKVAMMVYDARTRAGLTQAQLAKLVGTKQPVIARLEDADYKGHSLSMLQRIATALNVRLELRMVPTHKKRPAA